MFARLTRANLARATSSTVVRATARRVSGGHGASFSTASGNPQQKSASEQPPMPSVRTLRGTFDNWGVGAEVAPEGGGFLSAKARQAALDVHTKAMEELAIKNNKRREERNRNLALEAKAEKEEQKLEKIKRGRISKPIEINADTDLSFLTGLMKLKHHYNTVARGQKEELSSGLYNQMRLMVKLSKEPTPELLAHLNIQRLSSLAWRLLHTDKISISHCEAIVRLATYIPRGRQAPEVQHVAGSRARSWFIQEAHNFRGNPFQLNAIMFNRNFEYYKNWVNETSSPAGLIVNFVLSLKLKNRPISAFMEGELTSALVELGRFEEALVQAGANLKRAAHLSTSAIESYAYDYPSFENILDKIGATALPEETNTRDLLKRFTTVKGIEAAIVACVQNEAYNIAPQYYTLLQQLTGTDASSTVAGLSFDAACAMTVALSYPLGKDELPEFAETRQTLMLAIVKQALDDGVFVTGSDAKIIDLSQFSDPEVVSAVLSCRVEDLKQSGGLSGVSVRLVSHNELLAQKVSVKQATEAEAGAALSTEQQRELRGMLSQLDLVFETDIGTADFGGLGDSQDALTVRQLRTKYDEIVANNPDLAIRFGAQGASFSNNIIRPMSEISSKAGLAEVGKPDALVRIAASKVLESASVSFDVNDKASSLSLK